MYNNVMHIYNAYIANVLDIIVLTIIFYKIILVIKGTRAMQIVVGILFVLGLTVIARDVLHLKALSWLLDNFWFAAVIIFAVIFQGEIRNVLAQVGGQVWRSKPQIQDSYITEIVEAVEDLSMYMTGCLIAIENEIGLKNFTETGVSLNADISKELLLSIFKNKSAPLHDGAVIIFNGKISAAGCLFPLSSDTNVKIFGTRHRAALGLSEVTDAVIIVVSEETGRVSVAYKRKLYGNVSTSNLKEIIKTNGEVLQLK
ncbi:MAG: diadenylate cyclase CdaA [Endomicrobium sp.]|jgi:diadenylate cyclase|nr:diadenylate cyclase CdaA [Endomicrobium sp.]